MRPSTDSKTHQVVRFRPGFHALTRRQQWRRPQFFTSWSFPMSATRFGATALVVPFENLRMTDVEVVGGKNASLGEMISQLLHRSPASPVALRPRRMPSASSSSTGPGRPHSARWLRSMWTTCARWPGGGRDSRLGGGPALPGRPQAAVRASYASSADHPNASFAVRSSATAEDLPDASFAGQQETFPERAWHRRGAAQDARCSPRSTTTAPSATACWGFAHAEVACRPVCSAWCALTLARSGVMFTLDTEAASPTWCSSRPATAWGDGGAGRSEPR